jgi:hypothetical protein
MTNTFERRFSVRTVAELWGLSDQTIINMFREEPGIFIVSQEAGRRRKRDYTKFLIPESVMERVDRARRKVAA